MDVDLEAVLAAKKAQYKSTEVQKDVDLQYDLGNLLATDLNPLDDQAMTYVTPAIYRLHHVVYHTTHRSRKDEYLTELTRDNTQLLINQIWQVILK